MISWFWVNTNSVSRFFLVLPLQAGFPLVLVGLATILFLKGNRDRSALAGGCACLLAAIQIALFLACATLGVTLRSFGRDPSSALVPVVFAGIAVGWAVVVVFAVLAGGSWVARPTLIARLERAGAWRLSDVAARLVAFELLLLVPTVGSAFFLSFLAAPAAQAAVCLIALALGGPVLALILRGSPVSEQAMPSDWKPEADAGRFGLGRMGARYFFWQGLRASIGLAAVASLLSFVVLSTKKGAWLLPPLAVALGIVALRLPGLRELSRADGQQYWLLRSVRRMVTCWTAGLLLVLGAAIDLPGTKVAAWALDSLRPWVGTDERLARELLVSERYISGGDLGFGQLFYSGWRIEDELAQRGPAVVKPIASVLEEEREALRRSRKKGHWRPGSLGVQLVRYLGRDGQKAPPIEMLRDWSQDETLPSSYRGEAGDVLKCLLRGGFVRLSDRWPTPRCSDAEPQ